MGFACYDNGFGGDGVLVLLADGSVAANAVLARHAVVTRAARDFGIMRTYLRLCFIKRR